MMHEIMGMDRALPWLGLALGCGYLIGSIPFGVLMARVFGLGDLRKIGSGNIGATNVLRTGNKAAAAATLLLDGAKGAAAVLIFLHWGDLASQAAGFGAFLGHIAPVWLKFRGGKGVATFLGIVLALHWPSGLASCLVWLVMAVAFRISSLSALIAAAAAPVIFYGFGRLEAVLVTALLAALVWWRHSANIGRLLRGAEPKIGKS